MKVVTSRDLSLRVAFNVQGITERQFHENTHFVIPHLPVPAGRRIRRNAGSIFLGQSITWIRLSENVILIRRLAEKDPVEEKNALYDGTLRQAQSDRKKGLRYIEMQILDIAAFRVTFETKKTLEEYKNASRPWATKRRGIEKS
jgi:hypothetical protein